MSCSKIKDLVYESSENSMESSLSLFNQIQVWLHTIICPACAQEIERFEVSKAILREDFFPPSPDFEDSIMAKISIEIEEDQTEMEECYSVPGGLSTRGWVIAGLAIFVSLATVFFGLDFQKLADETGTSFLLPVGITIGIVLTTYGALFIGSHLKELTERFGL